YRACLKGSIEGFNLGLDRREPQRAASKESVVDSCHKPMSEQLKIIIEKHADGYVAYPLGLKGVVVGDGNTYDEALSVAAKKGASLAVEREPGMRLRSGRRWAQDGEEATTSSLRPNCPRF
ncbi:MAG: hypothetical protein WAL34_24180, partial [Acidobacteriaceae bacterium]